MKIKFIAVYYLFSAICLSAFAQSTAFTYQGQLDNGTNATHGTYNFTFSLYDAGSGGSPVAGPVTNKAVFVTNGLFTVLVDLGSDAFDGGTNWLQIGVETNGAGSFSALTPRQEVTPTPYAITAYNLVGLTIQSNANDAPNIIAGSSVNYVSNSVYGATIAGGGSTSFSNSVTADYGTVGGGGGNTISGWGSTVGGGANNTAGGLSGSATVSGGYYNTASGDNAAVGGGDENTASGEATTVGGGENNTASGDFSTVGGGLENNAVNFYATVGGGVDNTSGGYASTAAGGNFNKALGDYSTVGGGDSSQATGDHSTVGGGNANVVTAQYATVAGGYANFATNYAATVAGGSGNIAGGQNAIACGHDSLASGDFSFAAGNHAQATNTGSFVWADDNGGVFASTGNNQFDVRAAGGVLFNASEGINLNGSGGIDLNGSGGIQLNSSGGIQIAGDVSMAGGATTYHHFSLSGGNSTGFLYGSYPAWGDGVHLGYNYYADNAGTGHVINTGGGTSRISADYGEIVMAVGGVDLAPTNTRVDVTVSGVSVYGTFNNMSDRNAKQDFAPVDPSQVLDKVLRLPVSEWSYKTDATTRHIGPTAQDFYSVFNIGTDDKHIAPIDEGGLAFMAIQGLNRKVEGRSQRSEDRIQKLETENQELKARLDKLEQLMSQKNGDPK